jgi:acyl carrier protein
MAAAGADREKVMGLDTVELVIAFEEKFGVSIPDEDASQLTTPCKVTEYIVGKVGGRSLDREQVAAIVRQVVENQIATSDFSDDDHFVNDMNLDRGFWRR